MKIRPGHELPQRLYQTKTFTSIYAQSIGESTTTIFERNLKEDFLNFIPKAGKILEIGCGSGHQAMKILEDRHDVEIIASDMSAEMISYGQKKYQEMISRDKHIEKIKSNLSFVQADVMDLSQFGKETFDGIYSSGAIKHFPDQIQALNECIRVLKPGGKMFFTEFSAEAPLVQMNNLFARHIKMPSLLKPIISRALCHKHKTIAPGKADVEKWEKELSAKGFFSSEYLLEYPFFILKFAKK